ncbi:MAG: acyltransferase [Sphingobacteriales bacterium]|nr:MAG: acyltransferase [Sphingobacteriales bacterium]
MQQGNTRVAYLDWLRILAIIGVLLFHSAMAFVAEWGWHIKNKETSYLFMEFNFWLSRFRMPLLFFISGTVSYFMLQSKSAGSFIGLRFRRLFIPLLVGCFIIVPPQIYLERVTQGYTGNYFSFYSKVFEFEPYPKGNFSWHHLWFIAYLLVYDIVFAPVFKWFSSDKGKMALQRLNFLAKGKWIYLLTLPTVIILTTLSIKYPTTNDLIHDWCRIFYWLSFVLAGFICIASPTLMDSLERNRRTSFALAFLTIMFINYLRWNKHEPSNTNSWTMYAYIAVYAFTAWFWVMTLIGYGKRYLNKKHRVLNYLNQAVYPFYILHQTVIVIIVYYVVQTNDTILLKYLFTLTVSFAITICVYHLFIRPYAVMRFLFGMKPKEKITNPIKEDIAMQPASVAI